MSGVIQQIVKLANQTISRNGVDWHSSNEFLKLKVLMSLLRGQDVALDERLVSDNTLFKLVRGCPAPVTYVEILESQNYTLAMFILKNGARLPLHDHPGMHGIIKVVHGNIRICSYSNVSKSLGETESAEPKELSRIIKNAGLHNYKLIPTVPHHTNKELNVHSEAELLTPAQGNYHEIIAKDGPAAFVDLLTPPYNENDNRDCHYYQVAGHSLTKIESEKLNLTWLLETGKTDDFWCTSFPYQGPHVDESMK